VLWFVNITNRNFFMGLFPFLQQAELPDGFENLVTPWRVLRIQEDGEITAQYNKLANEDLGGNRILQQLFSHGSFVSASPLDEGMLLYLLSRPAYVYEYAFPMEPEWFMLGFGQIYGQRASVMGGRGMAPFRRVFIRPGLVFFLCDNGYVYEFAINEEVEEAEEALDEIRVAEITITTENLPRYTFANGQFVRHGEFFFHPCW